MLHARCPLLSFGFDFHLMEVKKKRLVELGKKCRRSETAKQKGDSLVSVETQVFYGIKKLPGLRSARFDSVRSSGQILLLQQLFSCDRGVRRRKKRAMKEQWLLFDPSILR